MRFGTVIVILFAAALALTSSTAAFAAPGIWTSPVDIGASGQSDNSLQLAVSTDNSITTAWSAHNGANWFIAAATSTDTGATWGSTYSLSAPGTDTNNPQIAALGSDTLTVTFTELGSPNVVRGATSTNGGSTWSSFTLSSPGGVAEQAQISSNGTTLTATWMQEDGGLTVVKASTSTDGLVWTLPVTVSTAVGNASYPYAASTPGIIAIAWFAWTGGGYTVQVATSSNAGATWSSPVDLATSFAIENVHLAITSDDSISVAWSLFGAIVTAASGPGGTTWGAPVTLAGSATNPRIAAAGSTVAITWSSTAGASWGVVASVDNGVTWGAPAAFTSTGAYWVNVAVAPDEDVTAVASTTDGSSYAVQEATSADGGATWASSAPSASVANARSAQVAFDGLSQALLVWQSGAPQFVARLIPAAPGDPGGLAAGGSDALAPLLAALGLVAAGFLVLRSQHRRAISSAGRTL